MHNADFRVSKDRRFIKSAKKFINIKYIIRDGMNKYLQLLKVHQIASLGTGMLSSHCMHRERFVEVYRRRTTFPRAKESEQAYLFLPLPPRIQHLHRGRYLQVVKCSLSSVTSSLWSSVPTQSTYLPAKIYTYVIHILYLYNCIVSIQKVPTCFGVCLFCEFDARFRTYMLLYLVLCITICPYIFVAPYCYDFASIFRCARIINRPTPVDR